MLFRKTRKTQRQSKQLFSPPYLLTPLFLPSCFFLRCFSYFANFLLIPAVYSLYVVNSSLLFLSLSSSFPPSSLTPFDFCTILWNGPHVSCIVSTNYNGATYTHLSMSCNKQSYSHTTDKLLSHPHSVNRPTII
jgi:hypothetical protein